jgi:hypothetical protein
VGGIDVLGAYINKLVEILNMKRTVLIAIIVTCLLTTRTCSQNIYSALQPDRDEEINDRVPTEVIEENIFFNSSGKEIKRNKKRLNSKKKVLTEERFRQDGKLEARLSYTYDSSGLHTLTRKFERWTNFGYTSETAFYDYDNNWNLVKVTDKTDKGKKIQETILTNNENGNPIQLELFDGNGNAYGIELATYDYPANKAFTEVQDGQGKSLSRDTLTIKDEIRTDTDSKYNNKGDPIESSKYFYEYEYDDFGNWTIMKIFKNVKGKKKNDSVFRRKFKYGD